MNNKITTILNINQNEIRVIRINNEDYISLTDNGKYNVVTFAYLDIVLEFVSWIANLFKLYLIKDFKRLKYSESYQEKIIRVFFFISRKPN